MASTAPLPDAAPTNWVDRYAPGALRPWLKLGRFDRPVGIWLLMLPGWQGIALAGALRGQWPDLRLLGLFFLGAALMRAAGCAYNDIVDRDIDAKVARTALRPIPAGQISVKQAWAFVAGCCGAAFLILISLPPLAIALGVGSLALVAAYPFMKRITWWPQAWLGLTFNWGILLGFAAASGYLGWPALILYAGAIAWTLGYDTIYAIQDIEDDALAGVKSSARRLGAQAPRAVGAFYLAALTLAYAAGMLAGLGVGFSVLLIAYAVHLAIQVRRMRVDDGALALSLFRSNAGAGLILFAAIVAGGWVLA
ncbi:MAG: 4-hydroxybenzoate octaprenyltransferase, partial [Phenylobacterium sp.]|nr:4-hydroxybenzoate octaprenyltransferase [Phenylobacterium sp.]